MNGWRGGSVANTGFGGGRRAHECRQLVGIRALDDWLVTGEGGRHAEHHNGGGPHRDQSSHSRFPPHRGCKLTHRRLPAQGKRGRVRHGVLVAVSGSAPGWPVEEHSRLLGRTPARARSRVPSDASVHPRLTSRRSLVRTQYRPSSRSRFGGGFNDELWKPLPVGEEIELAVVGQPDDVRAVHRHRVELEPLDSVARALAGPGHS